MEGEGNEKSFNRFDLGCASIVRGDCCIHWRSFSREWKWLLGFFHRFDLCFDVLAITRATKLAE